MPLGLAAVLLPLWAAWLRLRAPRRHALRHAALAAQMACWAALRAASQRAAPPLLAPGHAVAQCPASEAALAVVLLRLASHSWVSTPGSTAHLNAPASMCGLAPPSLCGAHVEAGGHGRLRHTPFHELHRWLGG